MSAPSPLRSEVVFVDDYNLDSTMDSGQVFGFVQSASCWEGAIGHRWVRLRSVPGGIEIHWMEEQRGEPVPVEILDFLQSDIDLGEVVSSFPCDGVMESAVEVCKGLRLLKQSPWHCLASFILSSTKQITQIKWIHAELCRRFGARLIVPDDAVVVHMFPSPDAIVRAGEGALRECKAGFRARYLLEAASRVVDGSIQLGNLARMSMDEARSELMALPGVGRKIADCVLLFTGAHAEAFPVDVWIARALRELYFKGREVPIPKLQAFTDAHFGPNGGYAQQYLFHYARVHRMKRVVGGKERA